MLMSFKRALLITMLTTACDEAPSHIERSADVGAQVDIGSADMDTPDVSLLSFEDLGLDAVIPMDLGIIDSGFDAAPEDLMDMAAADGRVSPSAVELIRNNCIDSDAVAVDFESPPETCAALFKARPELTTGCYSLADGRGGQRASQCYRHRALVVLVNNDIESDLHPDDTNADGVIDQGPLAGTNHPPDPFDIGHNEFVQRLRDEIEDWYTEVSYGSVYMDLESIYKAPTAADEPDRWFRLLALRPSFLQPDIFRQVCQTRGGMTLDDWDRYHFIVTIISHGTSTSGSQWRVEGVPTGPDCATLIPFTRNYVVMKNFRGWNRLGTLIHELGHGMNRSPRPAGLGHSEAIHALTGEAAEYGDHSDVMGRSSNRGHFSVAQKAFLRVLPNELISVVTPETQDATHRIHPIETNRTETKGMRVVVEDDRDYYVEMRRGIGNDSRLPEQLRQGVLIKRANDIPAASKSWFIDATPETPTNNSGDGALLKNRTYSDSNNGLHISLVGHDNDSSTVQVRRSVDQPIEPSIVALNATIEDGALLAEANAESSSPASSSDDLLYFWKLGELGETYRAGAYRTGPAIRIEDFDPAGEVWLFISDRIGGERIEQVWPPQD